MATNHEQRAALAWSHLTNVARQRRTTTYGELATAIGMHHRPLRYVLGLLQDHCLDEKLPPLTILVVAKHGERRPGTGFIAWDVDDFDGGVERVYSWNWSGPNPFEYASSGEETEETLAERLLNDAAGADEVSRLVKVRGRAQSVFRLALLKAYDYECAFCGLSFECALSAAHIVPWGLCSGRDRFDVRNGILLCAVHHALFDAGQLCVAEDLTISYIDPDESSNAPYSEVDRTLSVKLHGRRMLLPHRVDHRPDTKYLLRRLMLSGE